MFGKIITDINKTYILSESCLKAYRGVILSKRNYSATRMDKMGLSYHTATHRKHSAKDIKKMAK